LERGFEVYSSDLYDRGFGDSRIDFVTAGRIDDNIITNPPFHSAEEFVRAGLAKSRKKLALLLRLAFLEGANRQREIFSKNPPSRVWIFSERITLYPAGVEVKGTGTMAYAWFVWDKNSSPLTSELKWIPLGYRSSDDGQSVLPLI
jgi:hypothetical protein